MWARATSRSAPPSTAGRARCAAARRFAAPDPAGRGPVGLLNVESESELAAIARIGRELGIRARAAVRVNPNVDPHTHEYTTTGKEENKFGIDADQIGELFDRWAGDSGWSFSACTCTSARRCRR
ncbi:MAG: hypothetical protein U0002_13625 [Thermoanaerobaculia bacterium]